jgi:hypothetical protein
MAGIGKVSAIFTASSSGLTAGCNEAARSLKGLSSDVSALRGNMRLLTAVSVTGFVSQIASAAGRAVGSFVSMGQAQAEVIDSTSKMAARLGTTYAELAGLAHAGDLAGVSMDTLGKAATKADIAFVRASQGSSLAQEAFRGVGLSVDELQGKSPAERFSAITDAIAGLPTEAERAAASVKLFGKAGAELLPLFAGGSGAIREATDQAKAFGLALTGAQGRDVEAMNDAFTEAKAAVMGIVTQVTANLSPAIKGVFDTFTEFVGNIGGATIGQRIGDGILDGARFLAAVGDTFIGRLSNVWQFASGVAGLFGRVFDAGMRFASLLAGVGRVFVGTFQGLLASWARIAGIFSATARAVSDEPAKGTRATFKAAGQNFENAYGPGTSAAARAGSLSAVLDAALAQSRASAGQFDQAAKQTLPRAGFGGRPADVGGGLVSSASATQAVRAIDSRSKEGIAEMFRLMRGERDDTQERIAKATERVADNTEDMGIDFEELSFAG